MAPEVTPVDFGFMRLDIPSTWTASNPGAGLVVLTPPDRRVAVRLHALTGEALRREAPLVERVKVQLRLWVRAQGRIKLEAPPQVVPYGRHPVAAAAGTERVDHARRSWRDWLDHLLGRGQTIAWRFWAILNEHMLVLASAQGAEDGLEPLGGDLRQIIASIQLPQRALLMGRPFADAVLGLARQLHPRTAAAVIDDSQMQFGAHNVNLVGVHRRYLASPDDLAGHVRELLDSIASGLAAQEPREWSTVRDYIMPSLATTEELTKLPQDVAGEEWVNGLHVVYLLDERGTTRPVTLPDCRRWRLDVDALHEQAVANLVNRSHEITMEGSRTEGYTMLALSTPDAYNATRVLLPDLHKKLREYLGPTFYAAMPNREFLLAFNSEREEVIARVRQQVASDYAKARHPLSSKLFLVTADGIAGDPEEAENYSEWLGS